MGPVPRRGIQAYQSLAHFRHDVRVTATTGENCRGLVDRWRLSFGRRKLCDHGRNVVIESTSGDEFIEIHFVFDSAIMPLNEDRPHRHSGHCAEVFRPVGCPSLAQRLDDFFDLEHSYMNQRLRSCVFVSI
jgi:hypothetical protein